MALTVYDRLVLIAPEFSTVPNPSIINYLSIADEEIRPTIQGITRDKMIASLAAHYMTIALKRQGAGGEVTSVSEGKLSMTYSSGYTQIKSDLSLTSYGRTYERLMRSYTITSLTRVCFNFI